MKEQIYNGDWKEFCKIQRINPVFEHGTNAYTNVMYNGQKCQIKCSEFDLESDYLWLTITKEGIYICGGLSPYEPYIAPSEDVEFIIEQNTNYSNLVQQIHSIDFNRIRELSVRTITSFSPKKQQVLFRLLNQGTTIIRSSYPVEHLEYVVYFGDIQEMEEFKEVERHEGIEGCDALEEYMFAYGQMHQAKLEFVFQQLYDNYSDIFHQEEINIIDYGCGQAIGTMCYADFLKKLGITQRIKFITLIDPSVPSLKRAALHASLFFPDAKIITRNNYIHELEDDFVCTQSLPTLHIFSNTLDVLDYNDFMKLYSLYNETMDGFNQFVCVGPLFKDIVKDDALSSFAAHVNGENIIEGVLEKYELNEDKNWTCNYSCFSINTTNNLSYSSIDNAEHQYNRGLRYKNGYEYERDPQKAFECFKKSAELECAKAQYELGVFYAKGIGIEQDNDKAALWYLKAAEHGCDDAQYAVGMCYLQGKGEKRDLFKAYNMFKQASLFGNKKAKKIIHCVDDTFAIPQKYTLIKGPVPYEEFKKTFNQGLPLIYRETLLGHRYSLIYLFSQKGGFPLLVPVYINEIPSSSDDVYAEFRNTDGKLPYVYVYKKDNTFQNENDLPF